MKAVLLTIIIATVYMLLPLAPCPAQGTAITYQGRLTQGTNPASALYEMQFTIFDAPTNGHQIGVPVSVAPVAVSNGFFTVLLDFGLAPFDGGARWLEITVNLFGSDMVPTRLAP